jgi:hypothetical protein
MTAAHQYDVTVLQDITVPQPPQLHGGIMTGTTDRKADCSAHQGHESQE